MKADELVNKAKEVKYNIRTMVKFQHLVEKHFIENEHKFGYRFLSSNLRGLEIEVIVVMDSDCKLPHEIFSLFDFRIEAFYRITSNPMALAGSNTPACRVTVEFM